MVIYASPKECEKIIIALTSEYGISDVDVWKIINRITRCMEEQKSNKKGTKKR